jgi:excisionase family DNA binding protein
MNGGVKMAEFMDCEQAAAAAKCSVYKIREAIKQGELKAYRPGKGYVIDPTDLDTWVRSSAVKMRKKTDKRGG